MNVRFLHNWYFSINTIPAQFKLEETFESSHFSNDSQEVQKSDETKFAQRRKKWQFYVWPSFHKKPQIKTSTQFHDIFISQ